MIRVLVDSAADFRMDELQEKKIDVVPLMITVDDQQTYRDELDLTRGELYRMMIEEGKTIKTSQPSPQSFVEIFEQVKAAGDELICILLSSALSGTWQSACLAKELVDYDSIYIIDSLSATHGIRIMAEHALKLIADGCSASEIAEKIDGLKSKIRITAAVDTLKYLYLGGRVSKTTAFVADAVNMKPAIVITPEGTVGVAGKYLGISRAVKDLAKKAKNANLDPAFPLYLVYSYDEGNVKKLEKALMDAGVKVDGTYELGATIGVHIGPSAFGMIYVEK